MPDHRDRPDDCRERVSASDSPDAGDPVDLGTAPRPDPDGLWVLHHCDNAPCIEDSHHYLGDALDNRRDRQEPEAPWPGPYPRGECDVCGYESTVNALARHRNRTGH